MNYNVILLLLAFIVVAKTATLTPPNYPEGSFFTVKQDPNGVWWFVDPTNKTFWSKGVDVWMYNSDPDKVTGIDPYKPTVLANHGSLPKWADAQVQRALRWGVNTLGAWVSGSLKDVKIPYTPVLNFYSNWGKEFKSKTGLSFVCPDLYDPGFKTTAQEIIRKDVLPYINDPYLLGWYLDNEIHLGTNWWRNVTIFQEYVRMPTSTYAWKATQAYVKRKYSTIQALNSAWGSKFSSFAQMYDFGLDNSNPIVKEDAANFDQETCKLYFDTLVPLLRSVDPNHLVLGVKWNGMPNKKSLAVETSDVVSIDWYRSPRENYAEFIEINQITGKPLIIGEYCYRGNDTGHVNSRGGGTLVQTQQERATITGQFIGNMSRVNYIVGAHWFRLIDEPYGGRYDGEDSNMGLVSIYDKEYTTLTSKMTQMHALVDNYHGSYRTLAGQKGPRYYCPNSCSNHGSCHESGKCYCDPLYSGGDCSYYTGKLSETFAKINTDAWEVKDVNAGGINWYSRPRLTGTHTVSSSGLTMKVVHNDTACTLASPGRYWNSFWTQTLHSYERGWLNFTYKAAAGRQPRFSVSWQTTDKWGDVYGIELNFNQTAVALNQIKIGSYSIIAEYEFPYNISLAYRDYALLWGSDDIIKVYANNGLVMQAAAPEADYGVATTFAGIIALKYYMQISVTNCEYTTTSAFLRNFNYQVAKKSCPNSCSNKGSCDYDTGKCVCKSGYFTADCSAPLSVPPSGAWLQHHQSGKFVTLDSSSNLVVTAANINSATFFDISTDNYGGYKLRNAASGLYVISKSAGAAPLACTSPSASTWESFSFSRATTTHWSLWSYINEKFVNIISTGTNANMVQATLTTPSTSSRFFLMYHANVDLSITAVRILCRSNGNYLNVNASTGALTALSTSLDDASVFRLRKSSSGWTLQFTTSSMYMTVDTSKGTPPAQFTSSTVSTKETFQLVQREGNMYTIEAGANSKLLVTLNTKALVSTYKPAAGADISYGALFYIISS